MAGLAAAVIRERGGKEGRRIGLQIVGS